MDPITVGLGAAAILYGFYTLYLRTSAPEKFGKLQAMQEQWGKGPGTTIHLVAYTVVPFAAGVSFIMLGLRGGSLF